MTCNKVWHASHGPAHVAAHPSGREYAPRRAAGRAALSVLLLALVLLSRPTDALAASNPSVVYSDNGLYVVAPTSNGFDAALATIGLYSVRPRLTTDMLAKLSNESTGGDFYALAARFQQTNDTLEGFGNPVYIGILTYNVATYGAGNIMQATGVTSSDIANAKRDFNVIQNGGSLGGGGSGGTSGTTLHLSDCGYVAYSGQSGTYFTLNGVTYFANDVGTVDNVTTHRNMPETYVLTLSSSMQSRVDDLIAEGYKVYVEQTRFFDNAQIYFKMYLIKEDPTIAVEDRTTYGIPYTRTSYTWSNINYYQSGNLIANTTLSGSSFLATVSGSLSSTSSSSFSIYDCTATGINMYSSISGGSGGSGNVMNNWPQEHITGHPIDEPAIPTPPVYDPITYTNPTDDPLPTPPPETPVTPVNPIVTTDPTNTTPQDYTPWLSAILNELRNFHRDAIGIGNNLLDALATHCTHITTTIMDETEWLYDQLKAQLRAGVQAILNGLDQNCTEMMNYLEDLAQWLADQLQFTFNIDNSNNVDVPAYDDSSVIGWLKRIYNAIRSIKGSTIGTPISDKDVEDGFDWWAWILSLLDQLFDNVISQTVGDVEQFLDEFKDLFPLSIPWDMVAFLTMFAGTPTTPEVTLTFPAIASLGLPEYDLEIDLEPFDNAAYTIRQTEQIVFAFYLLFKTQWLLDTLKSATDAAGEFVEGLFT